MLCPGRSQIFCQPKRRSGGSPIDAGKPTYACGIAAALRSPWLVTVNEMVATLWLLEIFVGARTCLARTAGDDVANDPP